MKKMNRWLVAAGITGMLLLGSGIAPAQDTGGNGFGGGFGGGGNFDPVQIQQQAQQRMMNNYRSLLEVKNDAEWEGIKVKLQKVLDFRQDTELNAVGGLIGMLAGGLGGGNMSAASGNSARRGLAALGAKSTPEEEALQKALDDKVPISDLKTAQAKVIEARKARQAKQDKAQDELRKVLSPRQEAIALLNGIL